MRRASGKTCLKRIYLTNKSLSQVSKKPRDSQFWTGLMEINDLFLSKGIYKIQSGSQVRFWEDVWIRDKTLREMYPSNIVRRKDETVASILSSTPLNISFRRVLSGDKLKQWIELVGKVTSIELNNENDIFVWNLNKQQRYTVKSLYLNLMLNEGTPSSCFAWKIRVPLKIKIFLWFLKKRCDTY